MADLTLVVNRNVVETIKLPGLQGVAGPPGATGPQGPAGGSSFALTAGATLSGHRIVTTDASGNAIYADHSTLAHANAVIGLTLGAASVNASVQVQSAGEVTEPSWTFTPRQTLWLGTNGLIATTAPTTGFSLVIGYAMTATTIFMSIGESLIKV